MYICRHPARQISPSPPLLLPDVPPRCTCTYERGRRPARLVLLPPPRPPPPPPKPPVPCPHEQQGEGARSFMVPGGGWLISTAASLHRSRPRFHLVLLADTDTYRHTPAIRAASPTTTIITTAHTATPFRCIHETTRVGYCTDEATSPVSTKFSVSNDAAKRSKRPACSARQRKRVQELAAARAAHYDGICLARWRRISVARAR